LPDRKFLKIVDYDKAEGKLLNFDCHEEEECSFLRSCKKTRHYDTSDDDDDVIIEIVECAKKSGPE
jgi:hypothetical protein